jgi:hypothetical protein
VVICFDIYSLTFPLKGSCGQKRTECLVRELLGSLVSDMDVKFCETSIISQCVNPMVVGSKSPGKDTKKVGPPKIKDIKAYANHVVKSSLAGIQAIRKSAESKTGHAKNNKESKK